MEGDKYQIEQRFQKSNYDCGQTCLDMLGYDGYDMFPNIELTSSDLRSILGAREVTVPVGQEESLDYSIPHIWILLGKDKVAGAQHWVIRYEDKIYCPTVGTMGAQEYKDKFVAAILQEFVVPFKGKNYGLVKSHEQTVDLETPSLERIILQPENFGKSWGLIESPEKSQVEAVVGAISDDSDLKIGLTAMQLDNIGNRYGSCVVQLNKEAIPVEVYNAFGANCLDGNKIWISEGLAQRTKLSVGDTITIKRTMDEQGRVKYMCEEETSNPFGQKWGEIKTPVEGIVAAIDNDGYNTELYSVGLSAMQIDNLGINRRPEQLLTVEFDEQKVPAQVYNAFGMKSISRCGIRVSSKLAEDLGLKLEDRVNLI